MQFWIKMNDICTSVGPISAANCRSPLFLHDIEYGARSRTPITTWIPKGLRILDRKILGDLKLAMLEEEVEEVTRPLFRSWRVPTIIWNGSKKNSTNGTGRQALGLISFDQVFKKLMFVWLDNVLIDLFSMKTKRFPKIDLKNTFYVLIDPLNVQPMAWFYLHSWSLCTEKFGFCIVRFRFIALYN